MSANEQVMSIKLRIDEWDSGQRRGLWGGERNILETDGSRGQGNNKCVGITLPFCVNVIFLY